MLGTADYSFKDQSGTTTSNGLAVLRLVSVRPPAYTVKCVKCGTETTEPHSRIEYATCRNSGCNTPLRKRDRLTDERARTAIRERAAAEEARLLAQERMESETADYVLPARRPPVAGNDSPSTERQRLEARKWREQLAAEEQERQRPVEEAVAKLKETHRRIAAVQRERLLDERIEDTELYVAPDLKGLLISDEERFHLNVSAWQTFESVHPEFYLSENNVQRFADYWTRHGISLINATMIKRLYNRFVEAGVPFEEAPAPEPLPVSVPESSPESVPTLKRAPRRQSVTPQKAKAATYDGWDEDGNPHKYTEREVSRWSSEEMRRRLRMYPHTLTLPNVGPGPLGRRAHA